VSEHRATVHWERSGEFRYESYSRGHRLEFDHGLTIAGSAAPENIPPTARGAAGVDPEQAFVAALSACHMLWFLHLACSAGFVVDAYQDDAVGTLDKTWMSRVRLRPRVTFSGKAPSQDELKELHEKAHEKCFIANSVKTEVSIEPC
jgi:organic hydroperoxide reductase OsmC/OhrA